MTDFSQLLTADRGQKARAIHLVDTNSFDKWVKGRSAEDRALLEAHRFDGKQGFAYVILPRGNDFDGVSAVKTRPSSRPGAWQSSRMLCPKANISWRKDLQARLPSAGCSLSIASTPIAPTARNESADRECW